MGEESLQEIFKSPDLLSFLVYKGLEGAMNGLEEYKLNKKNSIIPTDNIMKKNFGDLIEEYTGKLSFFERITVKTVLSLPWQETAKLLYEMALNFGKKNDGSYKSTIDVITDCFKNYGNE